MLNYDMVGRNPERPVDVYGDGYTTGAAARLAAVGDKVIIISYGHYEDSEARELEPIVVMLDEENRPVRK